MRTNERRTICAHCGIAYTYWMGSPRLLRDVYCCEACRWCAEDVQPCRWHAKSNEEAR